jgi:PAS domain S-box-containing protein
VQDLVAVATNLAGIAIERRHAEEELRHGQELLELVGKATDDAVWDWRLVNGALWWGEGIRALTGKAPSELEPGIESWTSRIHPADRDRVVAGIHGVIEGGGAGWSDEYRFLRGDGSYANILDRGYVIRDENGRPVRMVGSMMDVTERTRAHQALAARERQFREAQRVARVGSWEITLGEQTVTWSEEMYRMYGLDPAQFRPTVDTVLALIAADDRHTVNTSSERAIKERRPFAYDLRIHRADGQIRILHCRGHAVADATGTVTGLIGTAQDVTERREVEERLRESQRRLRALTARREAILEDERARISREIHDELGQILTASKLDVAWVRDSLPVAPPDIRARLDELASRLDATVKTVRRITTELRPVVLDQLGLGPAVEWLARDFSHRTGLACSVQAALDGRSLPPETATGLFRILQEALTNVTRHANAAAVRVELWAANDTVCLEISDDGQGIPDADVAHGDGLGIMGMRERAILLGGALEIGTQHPSGTRVSVWAPIP